MNPGKYHFTRGVKIFIIPVKTPQHLTTEQTTWINPQPYYISSHSQTHSRSIITASPTEYPRVIAPQSTRGVTRCQEKSWRRFPIWNGNMRRSNRRNRHIQLQAGFLSHLWHNNKKQQWCGFWVSRRSHSQIQKWQNNAWLKWWTQCLKANKRRKCSAMYFNLC